MGYQVWEDPIWGKVPINFDFNYVYFDPHLILKMFDQPCFLVFPPYFLECFKFFYIFLGLCCLPLRRGALTPPY